MACFFLNDIVLSLLFHSFQNKFLTIIYKNISLNTTGLFRIFPLSSIKNDLIYFILLYLKIGLSAKFKRNIFRFAWFRLMTINIVSTLDVSAWIFITVAVIWDKQVMTTAKYGTTLLFVVYQVLVTNWHELLFHL